MRKFLSAVACFLALTTTVSAAVTVTPKIDYNNEKIIIDGISDTTEGKVGIFMFHPDKNFASIPEKVLTQNVLHFHGQCESSENGEFSFEIPMTKGESKDYAYYIGAYGEDRIDDVVKYCTKADMISAMQAINSATDSSAVLGVFTDKGDRMSLDPELYAAIDEEKFAKLVYSDAKTTAFENADVNASAFDEADINKSVMRLNDILDVAALTQGKMTTIADDSGCYKIVGENAKKWYKSKTVNQTMKDAVLNAVKKDFDSTIAFKKSFTDSLILTVTDNPSGVSNMKSLLTDFSGYLNLDSRYITDKAANAVSGNTYATTDLLVAAVKSEYSGGEGGGGGGGSTGGSSNRNEGGVTISVAPSTGTQVQTPEPIKVFEDLSTVQWAYEAIVSLTQKGIVAGKTETTFAPNDSITREEFVKLLVSAMELPLESYSGVFKDVRSDDWFAPYVLTGYKNNLCNGYGEGLFGSRQNISRQDMAVMIMNILKNKDLQLTNEHTEFADYGEISDYAKEAVKTLNKAGIMAGQGGNIFNPKGNATRAEAAAVVFRILEYLK